VRIILHHQQRSLARDTVLALAHGRARDGLDQLRLGAGDARLRRSPRGGVGCLKSRGNFYLIKIIFLVSIMTPSANSA
jgi:hypothetical protein